MSGHCSVPPGAVVVSEKFRGSEIHAALKGVVEVVMEGDLGAVDFYPASHVGCVWVPEAAVINVPPTLHTRLAALAKSGCRTVVLAECTALSGQYFGCLQDLVSLQLGLYAVPVPSPLAAATHITKLVKRCGAGRKSHTPSHRQPPIHNALLQAVQRLPKTGRVKANHLLLNFGNIRRLSQASVEELAAVVGRPSAEEIHSHLHQPISHPPPGTD